MHFLAFPGQKTATRGHVAISVPGAACPASAFVRDRAIEASLQPARPAGRMIQGSEHRVVALVEEAHAMMWHRPAPIAPSAWLLVSGSTCQPAPSPNSQTSQSLRPSASLLGMAPSKATAVFQAEAEAQTRSVASHHDTHERSERRWRQEGQTLKFTVSG